MWQADRSGVFAFVPAGTKLNQPDHYLCSGRNKGGNEATFGAQVAGGKPIGVAFVPVGTKFSKAYCGDHPTDTSATRS